MTDLPRVFEDWVDFIFFTVRAASYVRVSYCSRFFRREVIGIKTKLAFLCASS